MREKERKRRRGKSGKRREGGREKEPGRESVSAQSTHCLMFCSSATNEESKSSTDGTPAVIPTLFDVEPRKESGIVM